MRIVLGLLMIAAGALHFIETEFYVRIVPDYLPEPELLVYASGLAAISLGALLLWKKTAPFAAWGIVAFLVAVFPANLNLAFHPQLLPQFPVWAHWTRLPLQAVFVFWALRYALA